ncbi:MAG: hydantoinase/oxoprolinase family protein [Gammaproteobacteria bacterium]|jgi:N-methylhydantoinase A/oxoprolinase/acetone carboxylase beta subunit|nr:hydantoinase/oxoprolinase family protein [Gammaproteobacteria bacterium]
MIRVGVDVGGTNTDAVVMKGQKFLGGAKRPTTQDILTGVENAIQAALGEAKISSDSVDVLIIGTTHFVNALVQRTKLAQTGLIRMCLPSGSSILPFADWPESLVNGMKGSCKLVKGGYEMDGNEISSLDKDELIEAAKDLSDLGCKQIAISSVFATVRGDMEDEALEIITQAMPELSVTLSKSIGGMGLLERENAAIINASLKPLAEEVVDSFKLLQKSLKLSCPMFFTRNDGTLIEAAEVIELPVLTFACGPTNSMRGAAFLSGLQDALVVDVGGTTTDVGEVQDGFPRLAGTSVMVADVRTNFAMPDVISIGLGGGSIVSDNDPMSIGPISVGNELPQKAKVFGGDTLTATDLAVAAGRCKVGDTAPPSIASIDKLVEILDKMVSDQVARARTSNKAIPVIAVGGGSVMMPTEVDGLEVISPKHNDLANAVGAAIAQVSGQVSRVVLLNDDIDRDTAIKEVTEEATKIAVKRHADPKSISVLTVSDMPLSYLPGNNLLINVTVVGNLLMEEM